MTHSSKLVYCTKYQHFKHLRISKLLYREILKNLVKFPSLCSWRVDRICKNQTLLFLRTFNLLILMLFTWVMVFVNIFTVFVFVTFILFSYLWFLLICIFLLISCFSVFYSWNVHIKWLVILHCLFFVTKWCPVKFKWQIASVYQLLFIV